MSVPNDLRDAPVTVPEAVTSAGLWAAGLGWLVPMLGGMTLLNLLVHPKKTERISRFYARGQVALTGSTWRAVVDPAVDPQAAYVFAQNHTNHLDYVTFYAATPHFKQGLELANHFNYPVYGWFMKARGSIPVQPRSQGQTPAIKKRLQDEIDQGHSILTFPEGSRTKDGRVGPFRKGVFFIARDLGVSVVPVAVTGMYEVMNRHRWVIRPGHQVTVYVEAPVPTAGLRDNQITDLAEHVRSVIARRVDLYWEERQAASSPLAGERTTRDRTANPLPYAP